LTDVFDRSLEEQLQDDVIYGYLVDRDLHEIHEEYVSDDGFLDGDAPFGTYVTFEGGGPQFKVEDPYRAPWHRDKAVELLDEGYDELVDYWG